MKQLKGSAALAALVLAAYAGTVQAVEIPISNSGFELPDAGGGFIVQVPDGWTASAGLADTFVEDTVSVGMSGGDGIQYAGMDSNNGAGSFIYQDLGVSFQAGMAYRVDMASAHREGTGHGTVEFGVFSSDAIGVDLGTPGFMDIQGVWTGSGNPDADDMFNVFRDASALQTIGTGALGHTSLFNAGQNPPSGNVVVYIRAEQQGARLNFDNIRLDESVGFVAGDVDNDGDVDLFDYAEIRDNFRMNVTDRSMGDLNEDGVVDFVDFLEWRNNHPFPAAGGLAGISQAVPEPATVVLVGLAIGLVALRRRIG